MIIHRLRKEFIFGWNCVRHSLFLDSRTKLPSLFADDTLPSGHSTINRRRLLGPGSAVLSRPRDRKFVFQCSSAFQAEHLSWARSAGLFLIMGAESAAKFFTPTALSKTFPCFLGPLLSCRSIKVHFSFGYWLSSAGKMEVGRQKAVHNSSGGRIDLRVVRNSS